jgi:hypothetical protein
MNIQYVISGSNFATESILPTAWGQNAMDGKQLLGIARLFGNYELKTFPATSLTKLYWKTYVRKSYRVIAPLNQVDYSREMAVSLLKREFDWMDYGGKHKESRFTDFFQEIYLPERFGIQKKRAHLSSLIVNNELTREEALIELRDQSISQLQRENTLDYLSAKLEISRNELEEFIKMKAIDHRTYPNQEYLTKVLSNFAKARNLFRLKNAKKAT